MTAPAHDSLAVLRELMAQFPEIPVTWADEAEDEPCESPDAPAADDAPGTCADCTAAMYGDDERERGYCDGCHGRSLRDEHDEREADNG